VNATATKQPDVEVRITTTSIAGIDPETGEAWTYSALDNDGKPLANPTVRCRADRAHELITAGAAELTDTDGNPSPAELDAAAQRERKAMRDRIRLAERERELEEEREHDRREDARDKRAGRRTRR
jgi:hypothetical protein